jgi:DNA mismatch endonuclease (patch repair protein)
MSGSRHQRTLCPEATVTLVQKGLILSKEQKSADAMDRISSDRRSWLMSRVSSKDTGPELLLRRVLTQLGYRYRLHVRNLPGKPDIVFRSRRKAIFVHGCFWHQHAGCPKARAPASRQDYWLPKLARNRNRDTATAAELAALGWSVAIIWQCETKEDTALAERLAEFLGPPPHSKRGAAYAALASRPPLVVGQSNGDGTTRKVASRQIRRERPA